MSLEQFEFAFVTALGLFLHCIKLNAYKTAEYVIFDRFSNCDKYRPEAAGDVISGLALDYVGADVPARLGDFKLNSGRTIQLFVRSDPFCAFCAVFNCIFQLTGSSEVACDLKLLPR